MRVGIKKFVFINLDYYDFVGVYFVEGISYYYWFERDNVFKGFIGFNLISLIGFY